MPATVPNVETVYVPVNANVTLVVVQAVTTKVVLTELTVPLVEVGLNPASVIDEPTRNGCTTCIANATVPLVPFKVMPVAVKEAVGTADSCAVLQI